MVCSARSASGHSGESAFVGAESEVYVPHPIACRRFDFSDRTTAAEERAEIALVRFDESMRGHPFLSPVKRILMRTESLATVRSDGVEPSFEHHLFFEYASDAGRIEPDDQKSYVHSKFPYDSSESIEASYEAYRCMVALQWIDSVSDADGPLDEDDVWRLYKLAVQGTSLEAAAGRRAVDFEGQLRSSSSGVIYVPPRADAIDVLMDDFTRFCASGSASVFTRSAVEHFQLEALKPVNVGLDRWGRLIALLMWRKFGLCDVIMPPFSLTPGLRTGVHTELLMPYQAGRGFSKGTAMELLDRWVEHCAHATERSVKFGETVLDGVIDLQRFWRRKVGVCGKGTALDGLLTELAGMPIVSISQACALVGKKYQAVSDAVAFLVEKEILHPVDGRKRNRIFVASEAYDWLDELYGALFSESPVSREFFFL